MPPAGSPERRLRVALVLSSLIPSLALIALGAWVAVGRPAADGRAVGALVAASLLAAALLLWRAMRAARAVADRRARSLQRLTDWAARVAREEPIPPATQEDPDADGLSPAREAFRALAEEVAATRARALEHERSRAWAAAAHEVAREMAHLLAPMLPAVRALQRGTQGLNSAREPLAVLAAGAERLDQLADGLARLAEAPLRSGNDVDLLELLSHLLGRLPPGIDHRVRAPVDLPRIRGHRALLAHAFAKLLDGAAEAMRDGGGTVTVKLTTVGSAVEVRVLDTGPGGPPSSGEGEGMAALQDGEPRRGLALARQAVQAHGGGVWAHRRPEGGVEVRVVLPIGAEGDGPPDALRPQA